MSATQPWHDAIVAEIHATRERLADQYHDDLFAYSDAATSHCLAMGFHIAESPRFQMIQDDDKKSSIKPNPALQPTPLTLRG